MAKRVLTERDLAGVLAEQFGLEVIDLEAVCAIAKAKGANIVVDNIFATPILQRPLSYGADVIVYSGTKHMDGQGRVLGGAIMSTKKFKEEQLKPFLRHTGPSISPFNAWVLLKGLETMKLRVEAQSHSAHKVAAAPEAVAPDARTEAVVEQAPAPVQAVHDAPVEAAASPTRKLPRTWRISIAADMLAALADFDEDLGDDFGNVWLVLAC
mgnify:CR=1 FL=1